MEMRVLMCGGRDFNDVKLFAKAINALLLTDSIDLVIQGGAKGADLMAELWAMRVGIPTVCYPANWTVHGKAAGYIRNKQMLEDGKPDLVMAFPGGKGTANMVKIAREAGVSVQEIRKEI